VAARVIVAGEVADRHEVERLLAERHPDVSVESVAKPWQVAERATTASFDIAVLLKGPITAHKQRVDAIAALRRNAFAGRILYAAAFLSEKQDAIRAGADYVFDPDKQEVEQVIAAALYRPVVAADNAYLRALFVGERVDVLRLADKLPEQVPALILASTSCHAEPDFWKALAVFARTHPQTRCVVVEDDGSEAVRIEALATGVQPYLVIAEEGFKTLARLANEILRQAWFEHVSSA
jgi:DNA-binding NarL/FixJ family response regulator